MPHFEELKWKNLEEEGVDRSIFQLNPSNHMDTLLFAWEVQVVLPMHLEMFFSNEWICQFHMFLNLQRGVREMREGIGGNLWIRYAAPIELIGISPVLGQLLISSHSCPLPNPTQVDGSRIPWNYEKNTGILYCFLRFRLQELWAAPLYAPLRWSWSRTFISLIVKLLWQR